MMIKAVIFDFDNVLIDSIKQAKDYYHQIFSHFDRKFPSKNKERMLYTLDENAKYKLFFSDINRKAFFDYKYSIDFKDYIDKVKLIKGSKELLVYLKSKKIKIGLVTNRGDSTYYILDHFKIKKYFDVILTAKHIKKAKPDPYPINLAVKKLKVHKKDIIYVGDDKVDITAGKNAKVKVILYKNNFRGADYQIKNLLDIKKIISYRKFLNT